MSSRIIGSCALLVAVVAAGSWLHLREDANAIPESPGQQSARAASHDEVGSTEPRIASNVPAAESGAVALSAKSAKTTRVEQPEEIGLQVDAQGHLIKDANTRDELERILSGDPDGIAARRQEFVDLLPPAAAQEALDLLERFVNYRAALSQAVPDVSGSLTEQDALIMLDVSHNLRIAYFGQELTEAFFGAEEAIGRGTAEGILKAGSEVR